MKRKLSFCFALVLLLSAVCAPAALAVVDSNPCISSYVGYANAQADRVIRFDFDVHGTDYMDTIGASQLEVYTSAGGYVRTYYATNPMYEEFMMSTDSSYHAGYILFRGEAGVSYYAVITFTATKDGVTGTETYTTSSATATA